MIRGNGEFRRVLLYIDGSSSYLGDAVKRFADLSEQEVLALAISNETEDNRIYRSFADGLRGSYPDTAAMYDKMAAEEIGHHDMLLDLYRQKFGEFFPLIRRQDVKGFVARRPRRELTSLIGKFHYLRLGLKL